ncbi:hypothetical protein ICN42_03110 [Polynucleobacter sp. 71A-WALBACH]|uniref:hypothetical protein n=1 Tax=Polynucleobacter sp. 71A-WALBACH TaxID=2689097 RepID=UPI001C0B68A4|nr:hypothetical protein [Polynucleobacter sp. 71A-WALBACH]MBU3593080.1 hypothetical protein [Polynucleobacter sp. 71A-WALBACH]
MTSIAILTCVTGEPAVLQNTAASISPFLSENIQWVIKFSDKTDVKFANSFSGENIKIYREADTSLYDAMNQCLSYCQTDYYMVLGAGDMILPEAMKILLDKLNSGLLSEVAYHAPILFAATGAVSQPDPNSMKYFMSCPHPSSLLKVKNSLSINGFDVSYKIAADYDHLSRYALTFGAGIHLDTPPLVSFMGGGISDLRALEGYMEVNLVRMRVWNTPDIRMYGDMLNESATALSSNIRQNFP